MVGGSSVEHAGRESRTLSPDFSRNKRLVVGLVVAGVIALLLTFCWHSVAHAQEVHTYRPIPPGGPGDQAATSCALGTDLVNCFMDPTIATSTISNKNVQNPLAAGNTLFFVTSSKATVGSDQVVALWQIMLDMVDAFVVLIIMLNGLKVIIGGTIFRYADAVEALPGMLLALVAAHASILIVAMFLGLNNVLSVDLYNWAEGTVQHPNATTAQTTCHVNGFHAVPGAPTTNTCANQQVNFLDQFTITPQKLALPGLLDALGSFFNLTGLIVQILGLMMLAQVLIRLFFINLYIVFAPIGIACWALPGKTGQPLTRMWLQGFISTVLVQFVQVAALVVVQLMLSTVATQLHNINGLDTGTMVNILEIAVLWFILRIPSLFNTAPMRTMTEAGQAMGQAAGASLAVGVAEIQFIVQGATGIAGAISAARAR